MQKLALTSLYINNVETAPLLPGQPQTIRHDQFIMIIQRVGQCVIITTGKSLQTVGPVYSSVTKWYNLNIKGQINIKLLNASDYCQQFSLKGKIYTTIILLSSH